MKKILFLMASIACLAFVGCSDDDGGSDKDQRLVGTVWEAEDFAYEVIFGGECFNVLEFVSDSEVENYITRNGKVDYFKGAHSYTLAYPHLIIHYKNEDGSTEDYKYVFKSTRELEEVNQTPLPSVFIKQ